MARRPRSLPIALAAVAVTVLATAGESHACSCVGPGKDGWLSTFKASDGALIAKLVDKRPIGDGPQPATSRYVYEVAEVFKKKDRFAPGQTRRIVAPTDGASCGIERPIGATHALFVNRSRGRWTSNLCLSLLSRREMREAADSRNVRLGAPGAQRRGSRWATESSTSNRSATARRARPTTRTSKLCSSTAL